jgi:hypothetical protein
MKNRIGRQICCLNIVTPETLTFKQWKKKWWTIESEAIEF